jgi:hypothetical protein
MVLLVQPKSYAFGLPVPDNFTLASPLTPQMQAINLAAKKSGAVHPALRFLIIGIGTFPLVYLVTQPLVIAFTQGNWPINQQITTSLAITGGISFTVSLIDFFLGFRQRNTLPYEAI